MDTAHPKEIVLTAANIASWPKFKQIFNEGKIVADGTRRLRYKHEAPDSLLILTRTLKDGTARYQEWAAEWFDAESPRARAFVWP